MPYGRAKNPEVVDRVQRGQILQQPTNCPNSVYEEVRYSQSTKYIMTTVLTFDDQVMRVCWATLPEDRPSFRVIKEKLTVISQDMSND